MGEFLDPADHEGGEGVVGERDGIELPLIGTRETGTVSNTWTLMNLLRGMIGPGCFALPVAFKYCGLWFGFALMFGMGFLNAYCMMLLIECAQYLCERSGKLELDYGHLAKKAFDYGPERWQAHSKKPLYFTNIMLCVMQLGIGSVLMVFMASHLKLVLEDNLYDSKMDTRLYMCIILVPVILLNYIRELKVLAMLSTLANLMMVFCFVVILGTLIVSDSDTTRLEPIKDFHGFLLGAGSMLYAFEGQAMVLPMENKMIEPQVMKGWNGVLYTGMSIVTCLYAATGFFGYTTYGDSVQGSIAENLDNSPLNVSVKVMLVVAVYVGYGLQIYIVIEMLWPAIKRKLPLLFAPHHLVLEFVFRTVLVLITFGIGVAVPNLEAIIPLVGVTAGMILAFVIPPFLETVTFWEDWASRYSSRRWIIYWKLIKNALLILMGMFGLLAGLYANISKLAASPPHP